MIFSSPKKALATAIFLSSSATVTSAAEPSSPSVGVGPDSPYSTLIVSPFHSVSRQDRAVATAAPVVMQEPDREPVEDVPAVGRSFLRGGGTVRRQLDKATESITPVVAPVVGPTPPVSPKALFVVKEEESYEMMLVDEKSNKRMMEKTSFFWPEEFGTDSFLDDDDDDGDDDDYDDDGPFPYYFDSAGNLIWEETRIQSKAAVMSKSIGSETVSPSRTANNNDFSNILGDNEDGGNEDGSDV